MDKVLHFGVNFLVTMVISFAFPSQPLTSIGFGAGLSLGKEYGDSKAIGNHWDNYDLLADGVGISVGVSTGLYLRNAFDNLMDY